ncbi:MAG TPA: DUF3750 domain-containing protein [Candidatus Acidoferrales bacterium]|nr:DUF3750 domain-containing protein [Candidatus Acidoferrales bacterium]
MHALKLFLLVCLALPVVVVLSGAVRLGTDYRTADRSSAGLAPDPEKTPEAVVQVYAARVLNWRGLFGVHTWIATKEENASHYMIHHLTGWRIRRGLRGVVSAVDIPDRNWFGNRPELLAELRGPVAAQAIPKILAAAEAYPYAHHYNLWPGPNSNTFTAYIGRKVPELRLELPPTAIGKDFLANGSIFDRAPSGTGVQLSLYGMLGLVAAREEGVEINLLGLSFGLDFGRPALKLPFIGRVGASNGNHVGG